MWKDSLPAVFVQLAFVLPSKESWSVIMLNLKVPPSAPLPTPPSAPHSTQTFLNVEIVNCKFGCKRKTSLVILSSNTRTKLFRSRKCYVHCRRTVTKYIIPQLSEKATPYRLSLLTSKSNALPLLKQRYCHYFYVMPGPH